MRDGASGAVAGAAAGGTGTCAHDDEPLAGLLLPLGSRDSLALLSLGGCRSLLLPPDRKDAPAGTPPGPAQAPAASAPGFLPAAPNTAAAVAAVGWAGAAALAGRTGAAPPLLVLVPPVALKAAAVDAVDAAAAAVNMSATSRAPGM